MEAESWLPPGWCTECTASTATYMTAPAAGSALAVVATNKPETLTSNMSGGWQSPVGSQRKRLCLGSPVLCVCVRWDFQIYCLFLLHKDLYSAMSHLVYLELWQGGKALGVRMKAHENLNTNVFVCRYNVGKNGKQWCSFGQLLSMFKWICHEDSGSCCLVSNRFSKLCFRKSRKNVDRKGINLF